MKKRKKSFKQHKGQIEETKINIYGFYDKEVLNIFFEVNSYKYRLAEITGAKIKEKIEIDNNINLIIIYFNKKTEKQDNLWYEPIDYWSTCKEIKNQDKNIIKKIIEYLVK